MRMSRTICFVAAALGSAPVIAQPIASRDLPAREELYAFPSLIVSDQQFLTGDHRGKPITLTAELSLPQGKGRFPVVVLMHGSQGIGGNIQYWKRHFNETGFATLVIDSMSGRGLTGVATNQALIGRLNFIVDIYRSLDILAQHPRIDPGHVALMGFSRGGQAALYAATERFQSMWNSSNVQFAAYIPFYPDCATSYRADTELVKRPVRIFHGANDNYNPAAACRKFVARLRQSRADVELTEYPDAYHLFDNPLASTPARPAVNEQSTRECAIREEEGGTLINQSTYAQFSYKDDCVKTDPLVGYSPSAARAATAAVTSFLLAVFAK